MRPSSDMDNSGSFNSFSTAAPTRNSGLSTWRINMVTVANAASTGKLMPYTVVNHSCSTLVTTMQPHTHPATGKAHHSVERAREPLLH